MLDNKTWVMALLLSIGIWTISGGIYSNKYAYKAFGEESIPGKISFSSYRDGAWQIWSLNPDGSDLAQITHAAQDVYSPCWSADGSKLAYLTNEGEIRVIEEGKGPRKVSTPPQKCAHPVWSPDGSKIAFVCFSFHNRMEDSEIWIADLKEEKSYKFLDAPGIQNEPDWAPDGNSIVYSTGYWAQAGQLIEELWVVDVKSKVKTSLLIDDCCHIQPVWSPDGKRIAFASDKTGNMEIWVINKYGKNKKQLTHHKAFDADPCWSPDGTKICFVSTRGGKMDIWLMDKDGENVRQLTNVSEGDCKDPCWR